MQAQRVCISGNIWLRREAVGNLKKKNLFFFYFTYPLYFVQLFAILHHSEFTYEYEQSSNMIKVDVTAAIAACRTTKTSTIFWLFGFQADPK